MWTAGTLQKIITELPNPVMQLDNSRFWSNVMNSIFHLHTQMEDEFSHMPRTQNQSKYCQQPEKYSHRSEEKYEFQ